MVTKKMMALLWVFSQSLWSQQRPFYGLTWSELPTEWTQGAFIGEGNMGSMIYADNTESLRIDIGDSEIYNGENRVPIGKFIIHTPTVNQTKMTLDFEKALLDASFQTKQGNLKLQSFADRSNQVQRFVFETDFPIKIDHVALPGIESSVLHKKLKEISKEKNITDFTEPKIYNIIYNELLAKHTKEKVGLLKNVNYRQVFLNDHDSYVLLWKFEKINHHQYELVYATKFFKNQSVIIAKTIDNFNRSANLSYDKALENHFNWWGDFYAQSTIELPDYKIANQYWSQLYKIGSATQTNSVPLDLMGPWFRATPWAKIWCNLNVQITYPIMSLSNHPDAANTLFAYMDANEEHFINAVPKNVQDGTMATVGRAWAPYIGTKFFGESGNFIWMLHNYSQYLRLYPDAKRQQEKYYPLLKKGVNFLITQLELEVDGRYHFKPEISPEYKIGEEFPLIKDNNYNLGFTHWALQELIVLSKAYHDVDTDKYVEILQKLTPLVIDKKEGLLLGKDWHFNIDHRHFSHLVAIYPLGIVNPITTEGRELILKSVNHFLTRPHEGWGYKGYTYTAAAAMYARADEGDKALEQLNIYIDKFSEKNTFYIETGPVIETPMSYAASVLEMLVQSYSASLEVDEIKVATALPTDWKTLSFKNLPVFGGHKISASVNDGLITELKLQVNSEPSKQIRLILPKRTKEYQIKTDLDSKLMIENLDGYLIVKGYLTPNDVVTIW